MNLNTSRDPMAVICRRNNRTVSTAAYEGTHGRLPRGYGLWSFQRTVCYDDVVMLDRRSITANYGDAKRELGRSSIPTNATAVSEWTVTA